MATINCIRGGFEQFHSPPETSDHESEMRLDFWSDESSDPPAKYHCLDMDSPEKRQQPMSICAGCRHGIVDRYILRVNPNLEYHANCLKCFECGRPLDETLTAFVKHGQTYCREDYMRRFSTQCAVCAVVFKKTDMVMRAEPYPFVFHVDCFKCVACDKRLQTGEKYRIKNNRLYCEADCEIGNLPETSGCGMDYKLVGNNNHSSNSFDDDSWETSTLTSLDNHTTSPPLSPKSDGMRTPLYSSNHQQSSGSSNGSSGKKKKEKQTTRVRTVLNEMQLKTLKEIYAMNNRPDALLKEQLVTMTGLSPRVIRVWFQNKRCKDKKRQIQMAETRQNIEREEVMNRVRINGIGPLVAPPGISHIETTMGGPLEITHYQQWTPHQQQPPVMDGRMIYNPTDTISFPIASVPGPSPNGQNIPAGGTVFPHFSPQHGSLTAASSSHMVSSPTMCSE